MSQPAMPEEQIAQYSDTPPGETPEPRPEQPRENAGRRQLRRSKQNRVIGGVCGGLGRYVDTDPVLFRIAFLALLIPGGAGIIFYVLSWIIIPEFNNVHDEQRDAASRPLDRQTAATIVGSLLIIVGALILIERFIDWFDPRIIGGGSLVLIGAFIVWRGLRRGE